MTTDTPPHVLGNNNGYAINNNIDGYSDANQLNFVHIDDRFVQLAQGKSTKYQTARHTSRHTSNKQPDKQLDKKTRWQAFIGMPAYYWVLFTQILVILPHAAHLPVWLIIYAMISLVMQLPKVKAKFNKNNRLKRIYQGIQLTGFVLCLLGFWLYYNTAFGIDVAVAFLLLCLISKLWELFKRRDAYVVLNLSLFVAAALFLLNQEPITTLQVLADVVVVMMAFIAMNDDGNDSGVGRVRSLSLLILAAIPLLIVLFLFFPRLPPLWSVKLSGAKATTGMSNSMSPGDFANLSQSTELAFRVEFEQKPPPRSKMYWRGLVFSAFDGVTWQSHWINQQDWEITTNAPAWLVEPLQTITASNKTIVDALATAPQYRVIQEPTQQSWLFGLDYPFVMPDSLEQQQHMTLSSDFTLKYWQPVTQQLRYQVKYLPNLTISPKLSEKEREINTQLPSKGNDQAKAFAADLYQQVGQDTTQYINKIQEWITQNNFRYTLSPPLLKENRVDEFLFNSRAGFCEHYSSSFAFLMRAVGIPARIVVGYQGGQIGRDGASWEVRQMDAHAWTEVWIANQGWVRIDPTAFVAPNRVEQGMDVLSNQQGAALFGSGAAAQLSYQQYRMLQTIRRLTDQANYYWQRDIVGYDQDAQGNALLKWFNIKNMMQQIMFMFSIAVSFLAVVALIIWYKRRQQWHLADYPLIKLSKQLGKQDASWQRTDDEGMLSWLTRLSDLGALQNKQADLNKIAQYYRKLRYGKAAQHSLNNGEYQRTINIFRRMVKNLPKK